LAEANKAHYNPYKTSATKGRIIHQGVQKDGEWWT